MQRDPAPDVWNRDVVWRKFHIPMDRGHDLPAVVQFVNWVQRGPAFHVRTRRSAAYWCIGLVIAGEGEFFCGTTPVTVRPGMIFIDAPHTIYEVQSDPSQPLQLIQVGLQGEYFDRLMRESGPRESAAVVSNLREVRALMEAMHHEAGRERLRQRAVLVAQATTLIHLIARGVDAAPDAASPARRRFEECRAHIDTHARTVTQVTAVCDELSISRAHLDRLFRRFADTTPQRYLERVRMELVCGLLLDPDQTLSHIADQLGFSSAFALSRSFKRVFGIAPSRWRQEVHG